MLFLPFCGPIRILINYMQSSWDSVLSFHWPEHCPFLPSYQCPSHLDSMCHICTKKYVIPSNNQILEFVPHNLFNHISHDFASFWNSTFVKTEKGLMLTNIIFPSLRIVKVYLTYSDHRVWYLLLSGTSPFCSMVKIYLSAYVLKISQPKTV